MTRDRISRPLFQVAAWKYHETTGGSDGTPWPFFVSLYDILHFYHLTHSASLVCTCNLYPRSRCLILLPSVVYIFLGFTRSLSGILILLRVSVHISPFTKRTPPVLLNHFNCQHLSALASVKHTINTLFIFPMRDKWSSLLSQIFVPLPDGIPTTPWQALVVAAIIVGTVL